MEPMGYSVIYADFVSNGDPSWPFLGWKLPSKQFQTVKEVWLKFDEALNIFKLVGGLEHEFYFSIIYGIYNPSHWPVSEG